MLVFSCRVSTVKEHLQQYFDEARQVLNQNSAQLLDLCLLFVHCLEVRSGVFQHQIMYNWIGITTWFSGLGVQNIFSIQFNVVATEYLFYLENITYDIMFSFSGNALADVYAIFWGAPAICPFRKLK